MEQTKSGETDKNHFRYWIRYQKEFEVSKTNIKNTGEALDLLGVPKFTEPARWHPP
jgi:hypothetical protein